jgi:glycosyltransferase involved in cell wall biosynthesis
MPSVSIITALHNKEPYIGETIRSVLAQTMPDWEMIVVENGSTDNGPDVVRQFQDGRLRLVVSARSGPGAARNVGAAEARGEWLLFLDADDLIEPGYLKERLGLIESRRSAEVLAGCWEEFVDGRPEQRTWRRPAAFQLETEQLENVAIAYAPWTLHGALVKRSRVLDGRRWPEALDALPSEDAAFWFSIIVDATIAWSEAAGALYRVQVSTSREGLANADKRVRATIGVINHNLRVLETKGVNPRPEQVANVIRVLESRYLLALKQGNRTAADLARGEAERWLCRAPNNTLGMRTRRLLGLRLFNGLRLRTG